MKWLTVCRQHFQMHFIEWKCLYFKSNFTEVSSLGSSWQEVNIGSGNGLAPRRRQAITWTNDDQDFFMSNKPCRIPSTWCVFATFFCGSSLRIYWPRTAWMGKMFGVGARKKIHLFAGVPGTAFCHVTKTSVQSMRFLRPTMSLFILL